MIKISIYVPKYILMVESVIEHVISACANGAVANLIAAGLVLGVEIKMYII